MLASQDTLHRLHHKIDSLNALIKAKPIDAAPFVFKVTEAPVQAALIVAFATVITVILGFIFKDYWIPNWIATRNQKIELNKTFTFYKKNLFNSGFSFNHRLIEIFKDRSHFLLRQPSQNSFLDYKYKSTVFRFCVLLGYIRAYKILEPEINFGKKTIALSKISDCIKQLESAIADGQKVELTVAKNILTILEVDVENLTLLTVQKFGIEADHVLHQILHECQKERIIDASEELQFRFLNEIKSTLARLKIKEVNVADKKELIIRAASIKLGLIYRDWQQAIGDLMLVWDEDHYRTISYRKFEELWEMEESSLEKRWLSRGEIIFGGLEMESENQLDSRKEQLATVYGCTYNLLKSLYEIPYGEQPIEKTTFDKMPSTVNQ